MNLSNPIVIHVSEEAKKEWEKIGEQPKKKTNCPSCEIKSDEIKIIEENK
jgi:ribosomal protein L37AE/L43A